MSNISLYWFQKEAINKIEDSWEKGNRAVLVSVPTGGGKCVSADTLVWTNYGIYEIGHLANGIPPDMAVECNDFRVESEEGAKPCSHIYRSSCSPTLRVSTGMGYEIEGTYEHKILFKLRDGRYAMKRLDEVEKGDHAVIKKGCNLWAPSPLMTMPAGIDVNLDCSLGAVREDIYAFWKAIYNGGVNGFLQSSVERLEEIPQGILRGGKGIVVYFLMSLFSNGSFMKNNGVHFKTFHEKMSKQVQTLLLSIGIPSVRARTNDSTYYVFVRNSDVSNSPGARALVDKSMLSYFRREKKNGRPENGFFCDRVVKISEKYSEVYDLTIPDGHKYFANGFISHNTIIFSSILKNRLHNFSGKKGLVLVHRDSLMTQAQEKLSFVWPGASTGRVQGGVYDYNGQITVASVQTLAGRLGEFRKACENLDVVVLDEAHHAYANSWKKTVDFLKAEYNPRILGVTATPMRTNKKESLMDIFEDTPFSISIFQLIHEGFLSPLVGYSVKTQLDLKGVHINNGDYNVKELSKRISSSNYNRIVVEMWREKAGDRKSICFAVSIEHVESLTEEFKKIGARVAGIHSQMPRDEQRRIIRDFAEDKYQVLINCMLLTEGFDEPSVDCLLMARPTSSRILYIQMLGRGLRLYPGKKNCLLLDFTDDSEAKSLITMQDLLGFYGMDKAEKLYKEKNARRNDESDDAGEEPFVISSDTIPAMLAMDKYGEELDTAIDTEDIDVFDINKFAWSKVANHKFVIVRKDLSLAIYSDNGNYVPYLVYGSKEDKWLCPLSGSVDSDFAQAIANVYLFDYGDRRLTSSNAAWRSERYTSGQRQILESAIQRYNRLNYCSISLNGITQTKGEYSNMITAFFALNFLKDESVRRISRGEAQEELKKIILKEMHFEGGETKTAFSKGAIGVLGECSDEDRQNVFEVFMALQRVAHSDFAVQFMAANPIEVKSDAVTIYRKNYPPYPLTEKQRKYLLEKIRLVFRLYFRNKKLDIGDGDARKT